MKRSIALLLTFCLLFLLQIPASAEGQTEEVTLMENEWYDSMLQNAQVRLGNNTRLKDVIARAQRGEPVTIAVIGGSITEGAGAANYKECWAMRVLSAFRAEYGVGDGTHIGLVNAGVGGTPSTFGWLRYERDILSRVKDPDGLPDLVIIEYAVNDGGEPTVHGCYESMVRSVLSAENAPAVLLLFSVFPTGYSLQNDFIPIGNAYDLTMVSMKNSAYPYVGDKWTEKEFFFDQYHPTSLGHQVMADCVMAAIRAAAAQETPEKDIDVASVDPVYHAVYTDITRIFASGDNSALSLNAGGFDQDDRNAYTNQPVGRVCGPNFAHTASSGNEPLTFTGTFARMLISFRTVTSKDFGAAEVYVDGKKVSTLRAVKDGAWGQSDTALVYTSKEAMEHTVEIRMAEGSEDKCFTVTCIGIAR